jgi:hypothetical protein
MLWGHSAIHLTPSGRWLTLRPLTLNRHPDDELHVPNLIVSSKEALRWVAGHLAAPALRT